MASIEEKVEEHYKAELDNLGVRHYGKTEQVNEFIARALREAESKSGGSGVNYPDIQLLLQGATRRDIPVMIEVKGTKGRLERLDRDGDIELRSAGKNPNRAVESYAVNGALHYGLAVLNEGTYSEVIIVGVNGSTLTGDGRVADPEMKAYYVCERNGRVPKVINGFGLVQAKTSNLDDLYAQLDRLTATDAELEAVKRDREERLEEAVKGIHQRIYEDADVKNLLGTNAKLFLFCGLVMAGLPTPGIRPLTASDLASNDDKDENDGEIILRRVRSFLGKRGAAQDKVEMVMSSLTPVFSQRNLWRPVNGVSIIRSVYTKVEKDILPLLGGSIHLDFTGKILNSLNDWVAIENDRLNDVVLTPRPVTNLMARMARTDMDSFVWDTCMGSSGFLVSAMELMLVDARARIKDAEELEAKSEHIRHAQLLGIEILSNIFILAVLNMILMGDGSSQVVQGDSHKVLPDLDKRAGGGVPSQRIPAQPALLGTWQGTHLRRRGHVPDAHRLRCRPHPGERWCRPGRRVRQEDP